jgi:hypothetical protein
LAQAVTLSPSSTGVLFGFANRASDESEELVKASREATLLAEGCSEKAVSDAKKTPSDTQKTSNATKREQAQQTVED